MSPHFLGTYNNSVLARVGMKVGILPKDWEFENCDTTHKPMMINDYW